MERNFLLSSIFVEAVNRQLNSFDNSLFEFKLCCCCAADLIAKITTFSSNISGNDLGKGEKKSFY